MECMNEQAIHIPVQTREAATAWITPHIFGSLTAFALRMLAVEEEQPDTMRKGCFMNLIKRHDALITKICFYFADSNNAFDDLRQDTLLNIWKGLSGFRGESKEVTWVYRICFNTCVSTVKSNSKALMPSLNDKAYSDFDREDEHDDLDDRIAVMHRCISMLDPVDRSMVLMQLDGRNYEEMAAVTGMNRNTVATRLRRAKEKLRDMMKE